MSEARISKKREFSVSSELLYEEMELSMFQARVNKLVEEHCGQAVDGSKVMIEITSQWGEGATAEITYSTWETDHEYEYRLGIKRKDDAKAALCETARAKIRAVLTPEELKTVGL